MSCDSSATKRYEIELIDVIQHSDETFSFDFKYDGFEWAEGDSSKLYVDINGREIGKKFSHATLTKENTIRFTTRIKEERSPYKDELSKLKIGDTLEISEPKGDFKLKRENRPIVLLSNGVGIAAVRPIIKLYEENQSEIPEMMQINVDRTGSIYKEELDRIRGEIKAFNSYYLTGREAYYGLVDHELQMMLQRHDEEPLVYVVGSGAFVKDNVEHLKDVGFLEEDILTDGHVSGGCGCSSSEGCGCGGNMIFEVPGHFSLPVVS